MINANNFLLNSLCLLNKISILSLKLFLWKQFCLNRCIIVSSTWNLWKSDILEYGLCELIPKTVLKMNQSQSEERICYDNEYFWNTVCEKIFSWPVSNCVYMSRSNRLSIFNICTCQIPISFLFNCSHPRY